MEIIKMIAAIPLFKGLDEKHYEDLAMILTVQEFKRGQTIFSEGDAGVGFYVVNSGLVKVYKLSTEGKEQILHILGPNEPFAEVAVLAGANYPAHAMALEQSRIFFFPKSSFSALIRENPSLAMNMLAVLAMRLRKFSHMIESLSLKEVPGRLAAHLIFLSSQQNGVDELQLKIAKTQLASLLGTIPETLSRIFAKMSKQGLIALNGARVTIRDRQGLLDLAEGETRL